MVRWVKDISSSLHEPAVVVAATETAVASAVVEPGAIGVTSQLAKAPRGLSEVTGTGAVGTGAAAQRTA